MFIVQRKFSIADSHIGLAKSDHIENTYDFQIFVSKTVLLQTAMPSYIYISYGFI